MTSFAIVTPMHNEVRNIAILAEQLAASSLRPDIWVVVDDGSTDASADALRRVPSTVNTVILERINDGGLIGGSAFTAWQFGVDYALRALESLTHVMKLDADVDLPKEYLERAFTSFADSPTVALVGGILIDKQDREQTIHVPGPVKLYSYEGYRALDELPRAVGFDVMDEVAIQYAGLRTVVRKDLPFSVRRPIGASQGLIHGRRRNGKVCRWTGYWTPYFLLHALRYVFRKPFFVGSIAMVFGYFRADPGPYNPIFKALHADIQKNKIKQAMRTPVQWLRATYGVSQ